MYIAISRLNGMHSIQYFRNSLGWLKYTTNYYAYRQNIT